MNFSISRNSSWMSAWKKSQFCQTNRKTFTTCPSFRLWQRMFSTNYLSLRMENNIVPAFRDFRMVQTPFFEAAQWRVSKKDSSLWWRHSAKCMKWYWQYDTVVSLELYFLSHAPDSFKALFEHLTFSGSAFFHTKNHIWKNHRFAVDSGLPYEYQLLAEALGLP